jgi:hypothetical protein
VFDERQRLYNWQVQNKEIQFKQINKTTTQIQYFQNKLIQDKNFKMDLCFLMAIFTISSLLMTLFVRPQQDLRKSVTSNESPSTSKKSSVTPQEEKIQRLLDQFEKLNSVHQASKTKDVPLKLKPKIKQENFEQMIEQNRDEPSIKKEATQTKPTASQNKNFHRPVEQQQPTTATDNIKLVQPPNHKPQPNNSDKQQKSKSFFNLDEIFLISMYTLLIILIIMIVYIIFKVFQLIWNKLFNVQYDKNVPLPKTFEEGMVVDKWLESIVIYSDARKEKNNFARGNNLLMHMDSTR